MTRVLLELGFRLASLSDYVSRARAVFLALSVAIAVLLLLATATVPFVLERQQTRLDARSVVGATSQAAAPLMARDTAIYDRNLWNGHKITRLFLKANDTRAPVPPGADSVPEPHTVLVSPALGDLLAHDPVVAALFEGYRVTGTIGDAGLVSPFELRAIVGIGAEGERLLTPAKGFGPTGIEAPKGDPAASATVAAFLVLLIALPTAALIALAARLSAERRVDRATCLRLLGLSTSQVRSVLALESALIGLPAAATGLLVFTVVRPHIQAIPGTGFDFFSDDAHVPIALLLGVPLAVVTAVVTTAAWYVRDNTTSVNTRARRPRPKRRLLLVGLVGLCGFWLVARERHVLPGIGPGLAFAAAIAGCAFAAVLMGPAVVSVVGRRLRRISDAAWAIVGSAHLESRSGSTTRLAAVLSIVIVAMGAALPVLAVLNGGDEKRAHEILAKADGVTLQVEESSRSLTPKALSTWPEVRKALPMVQLTGAGHEKVRGVVAKCADVQHLTAVRIGGCDGSVQWLSASGVPLTAQDLPRSRGLSFPGGPKVAVPLSRDMVSAVGLPDTLVGYLLIPPGEVSPAKVRRATIGSIVNLPASKTKLVMAKIDARVPGTQVAAGEYGYVDPDQSEFADEVRWMMIAFTVCLTIGTFAVALSAIGEAASRRSRVLPLLRLGMPRSDLARYQVLTTALPIALLGVIASLIAFGLFGALRATDDRADVSVVIYGGMAAGSIVVATLVAVLSLPPLLAPLEVTEVADRS